jgi:hypothetical protein
MLEINDLDNRGHGIINRIFKASPPQGERFGEGFFCTSLNLNLLYILFPVPCSLPLK